MGKTYNFDEKNNRLNTKSYKWDLLGEEYIPLWVADTDFEVPPAVTRRLQARVDHGMYGYLLTGTEVYDSICGWFDRALGVKIEDRSWIKLLPGIVPALSVASNLRSEISSEDGVIKKYITESLVCTPNYSMLLSAPIEAGNKMIGIPLINSDEKYSIDFEKLERSVTARTKVFYLCNPHNPVGRVYTYEELKAISEFAKKHDLIVVSDEVHCEIVYEGRHIPFFMVDDYAKNHSICLYSNGKLCNLADLILSFAIIPNDELRAEYSKLCYAFGEEHILNVEAGAASYAECDEWKAELLEYLRENRDYLEGELKKRFPLARLSHLEGTYLQWADFRAYGENIDAEFFKQNAKVFLSGGEDFGQEGYVRINFATQRAVIKQALDRMEEALKPYMN